MDTRAIYAQMSNICEGRDEHELYLHMCSDALLEDMRVCGPIQDDILSYQAEYFGQNLSIVSLRKGYETCVQSDSTVKRM